MLFRSKLLRHEHIEVVQGRKTEYLRITTDFSKTINSPVVSMPEAVAIYRRLVRYQRGKGYGAKTDYLFFPKYRNRDVALQHLRLQFQEVLARIGLGRARTGEKMTLYSLRHTYATLALVSGDVDIHTLSRQMGTSVAMLERHYSKLTATMAAARLG